jgi:hypothetical protein
VDSCADRTDIYILRRSGTITYCNTHLHILYITKEVVNEEFETYLKKLIILVFFVKMSYFFLKK